MHGHCFPSPVGEPISENNVEGTRKIPNVRLQPPHTCAHRVHTRGQTHACVSEWVLACTHARVFSTTDSANLVSGRMLWPPSVEERCSEAVVTQQRGIVQGSLATPK